MPFELNRSAVFAALAAFVVALAVAYALSSTGQASERSGTPGAPAQALDVASGVAGQSTLGEAEALPSLVARPKPKPPPEEPADEPAGEPAAPPVAPPAPVDPGPVIVTPQPPVDNTPAPPAPEPEVFEDSG